MITYIRIKIRRANPTKKIANPAIDPFSKTSNLKVYVALNVLSVIIMGNCLVK